MFQMGRTPFYLFPTSLGWEVHFYDPPDKARQLGGEYRFCWIFPDLRAVFSRLPELARLKLKNNNEKLSQDARSLEHWLKQTGKEALPHLEIFHKLLLEAIQPFSGWQPEPSGKSYPLEGTRLYLTYLGRGGWELWETEPGVAKPEFRFHALDLTRLLVRLPLLLSESLEAYRDKKQARGNPVKYAEITIYQTRKILRQLQKSIQPTRTKILKAPAKPQQKAPALIQTQKPLQAPVPDAPAPKAKRAKKKVPAPEISVQQRLF